MFDSLEKQNVADRLKALILDAPGNTPAQREVKRRAFDVLQNFERGGWNPTVFEQAFAVCDLAMKGDGRILYVGDGDPIKEVERVLSVFRAIMEPEESNEQPPDEWLMTAEAAAYIGVSIPTMKRYHYMEPPLIVGKKRGNTLFFRRDDLDKLKDNRPRRGQPPKRERMMRIK